MTRKKLHLRISIDPNICFGKPCIKGHRIWVSLILDLLASGMTTQEILKECPGLEEPDALACIAYGARCHGSIILISRSGAHREVET